MNILPVTLAEKINEEAIYNVYIYLVGKQTPHENEIFRDIVYSLSKNLNDNKMAWINRDILKLNIIKNAVSSNPNLANSRLIKLTHSDDGLTACCFIKQDSSISVIFKGTGSGEWIDNGEGLSGIPEENVYLTFNKSSDVLRKSIVFDDYATDQQVEALNWFNTLAYENKWSYLNTIIVSGHSKGGNKAQFVAINSPLVDFCYSFDGHGFSPEAVSAFKKRYMTDFDKRILNIFSIAAENDYVNVLGKRLMPEENIYYLNSHTGLHYMEALLSESGKLNNQCERGKLSAYIESVSDEIMEMKPDLRQYATLGIMNIFQRYLGKGTPVNADSVSIDKTITGLALTIRPLIKRFKR